MCVCVCVRLLRWLAVFSATAFYTTNDYALDGGNIKLQKCRISLKKPNYMRWTKLPLFDRIYKTRTADAFLVSDLMRVGALELVSVENLNFL